MLAKRADAELRIGAPDQQLDGPQAIRLPERRLLGACEIIHHTDCGMLKFTDDDFKAQIEADTGLRPGWAPESFHHTAADVKQCLARITTNPLIPHKDHVRGFVRIVTDRSLTEII